MLGSSSAKDPGRSDNTMVGSTVLPYSIIEHLQISYPACQRLLRSDKPYFSVPSHNG